MGRLFQARKKYDEAIISYERAISILGSSSKDAKNINASGIIQEYYTGYRLKKDTFSNCIRPVYTETIQLILNEALKLKVKPKQLSNKLKDAVSILESLKQAELVDFFHDECVKYLDKNKKFQ
ncbi:MAG: hypothetical protein OMM_09154 [Candidatus Magnetoglobus multicellularis str. Araruama]|uniref:Uncharacterized protein n=1 Tax=Candidatus Magnetoglobus multicellularis str. Araruama TaxID=890399 RepID=A0A1V1P583_9BACT|nr:MAG: hypothetical protein OMM_09154 [Candidatus Magnetoglobus multicellularis str. Araruama]